MPVIAFARPARLLACVLALGAPSLGAAAEPPPDISGVAPSRSFVVLSIPNFKEMSEALKRTELGKLWDEPAVKTFGGEMFEDFSKDVSEFLESIKTEEKDLTPPEGQVGLALFLPELRKGEDIPKPFMLAMADMGARAEEYDGILERLLERGEREKKITVEDDTYEGTAVIVVRPVVDEGAEARRRAREENGGFDDEDGDEDRGFDLAELIGGSDKDPRAVRIARVGTIFVAATDERAFEDAVDGLGGRDVASVADERAFARTIDMHPRGQMGYAVVLLKPLLAAAASAEDEGGGPTMTQIFGALGLSEVESLSLGVRLDTPEGMLDLSMASLVPQKRGLLELFTAAAGAFEPPAFVPGDAASVSRFSFDFPRVFTMLRAALGTLPEEMRSEAAPSLEMARDMLNPAMQAMGPAVHVSTSYVRPLSAESERTTFAIDVRDQDAVSNAIGGVSMKFGGLLEEGDFEGNVLYTSGFGDFAIGIGFNRLFVGNEMGVQSAMRLASRPEGATLAAEPQFKDATRVLAPGAIFYSWTDMRQSLQWMYWSVKNQAEIMDRQLAEMGLDPEQRAEILKRQKESQPKWLEKLPPLESVLPHLGDMVSEMHATPEGFRGRTLMIRPAAR